MSALSLGNYLDSFSNNKYILLNELKILKLKIKELSMLTLINYKRLFIKYPSY